MGAATARVRNLAGLGALFVILGTPAWDAATFPLPAAACEPVDPPLATILFMSDTHDSDDDVIATIARQLRTETGIDRVVHAGDVGDEACRMYGRWWDVPYGDLPWPVAAVSGNHDDPGCFAKRFGILPRIVSLRGVDFFLLPWAGQLEGEHLQWLDRETARSTAAVKVLVIHKAPWHISENAMQVREPSDEVKAVLRRIDLVLAGHNHVFWDSTHDLDGHAVRQVIEVTGSKFYPCVAGADGCVAHSAGYSIIAIYGSDDIRVSRRSF